MLLCKLNKHITNPILVNLSGDSKSIYKVFF